MFFIVKQVASNGLNEVSRHKDYSRAKWELLRLTERGDRGVIVRDGVIREFSWTPEYSRYQNSANVN